jgi:hypothetical protein
MGRRLILLFGAIAIGGAAGVAGEYVTGSSAWFLAVPGAIMFAWFLVADPTRCLPRHGDSSRNDSRPE